MTEIKPIILYNGEYFTVEYAIRLNGSSESKEFIEGLELKDKAKIIRVIKRFANFGKVYNTEQFKKVEDVLWEFKSSQIRILMFHCSRHTIALTHGFIKKSERIPQKQIDRAYNIINEYSQIRKDEGW